MKRLLLALLFGLLLALTATAQTEQPAIVVDTINVRTEPSRSGAVMGQIAVRSSVIVEARNRIGDWVLVRAESGLRGWVASRYVAWSDGIALANLTVSEERFNAAVAPSVAPSTSAPTGETAGNVAPSLPVSTVNTEGLSPRTAELVNALSQVPVLPTLSQQTKNFYREAIRIGRTATNFAKVGDCNVYYPFFLKSFSQGTYDLGEYAYLQDTINYYKQVNDSFNVDSMAGQIGHLTTTVIDPLFADTVKCPNQSMLSCEYARQNSPLALVMLGMSESFRMDSGTFRASIELMIQQSVSQYVLPIFFLVPVSLENNDNVEKMLEFNLIITEVARVYDVPVVNLWLAAQNLPSDGLEADRIHVTNNLDYSANFTGWQNEYAATLVNLLALQMLDQFRLLNG